MTTNQASLFLLVFLGACVFGTAGESLSDDGDGEVDVDLAAAKADGTAPLNTGSIR